jgi:hypothetical protein
VAQLSQDPVDVDDVRLFALPVVRQDCERRVAGMLSQPADVAVELRVQPFERRSSI